MPCFHCNEKVLESDNKFYLGLDIPYINLLFHRVCFWSIKDINSFLNSKIIEIYALVDIKSSRK